MTMEEHRAAKAELKTLVRTWASTWSRFGDRDLMGTVAASALARAEQLALQVQAYEADHQQHARRGRPHAR